MITKEEIEEIQHALLAKGIDVGKAGVDGKWGGDTRKAIHAAIGLVPHSLAVLDDARPAGAPDYALPIRNSPKATRRIDEVIVHCTATPEDRAVTVNEIRGWHLARGWRDIGYHWVVLLDGTIQPGRPEAQVGAHVEGHNTGTLGIVYVGGVAADGKTAKDTRTPAQKAALLAAVKALLAKYPAIDKVSGHNQYANKACPSFDVRKDALGALV